jgi:hypothetical protein
VHAPLTRAGCVVTGFDNPGKSLYTSIRELVENSLDAAEAIGVLPEVNHQLRAPWWAGARVCNKTLLGGEAYICSSDVLDCRCTLN